MLALVTITAIAISYYNIILQNHTRKSFFLALCLNKEYFLKGKAIYHGTFVKICLQIVYGYGY